jgi:hypothetical protein
MSKVRVIACLIWSLPLGACASVSVIPLDYNGRPKTDEAPGVRYYMPKPYLLVTQIKNDQLPPPTPPKDGGGGAGAAGGGDPTSPDKTSDKSGDQNAPASPSPSSDLSYQLGNSSYLLNLIYLPDMSKTMAINIVPGVFGTSSAQPTLQDGWMLTSLQASSDNTKALDDFTTLASALIGGGTKGATQAATTKGGGGAGGAAPTPTPPDLGLPPGLYEFRYDEFGHLFGLCAVTLFSNKWPSPTHPNYGPITNTGFCPSLEALARLNVVWHKG